MTLPFSVHHDPPWLIARFAEPQKMLSWAVHRSGYQVADRVAWLQVRNADLPVSVDPADHLGRLMDARGLAGAVGLMTSSALARHQVGTAACDGVAAACLMTLGLSNAERVGTRRQPVDPDRPAYGTINALCRVSVPLGDAALLEALSVATQARTTAILSYGYAPAPGAGPVTGTGTDCLVLACPARGPEERFAGLHTAVGEALGAAVLAVTAAAMADWLRRQAAGDRGG